jgi:hypothetical protein
MVLAVTGMAAEADARTVRPTKPTNIIAKAMFIPRNMSTNTHNEPITPTKIGSAVMQRTSRYRPPAIAIRWLSAFPVRGMQLPQ